MRRYFSPLLAILTVCSGAYVASAGSFGSAQGGSGSAQGGSGGGGGGGGGGGSATLQSAYNNGQSIATTAPLGPVKIVNVAGSDGLLVTNNTLATGAADGLDVVGDGTPPSALLTTYGISGTTNRATFAGRAARGSFASPANVQTDDTLVTLSGLGYGTTGFASSSRGRYGIFAAENWTDSAQGTYLKAELTQTGATTPLQALLIMSDRTAAGYQSSAGSNGTAFGVQSAAPNAYDTATGFQSSTASGSGETTCYGALSHGTGAGSCIFGVNASDANFVGVVFTWNAVLTASNQFVCGGSQTTISDVFFGNGAASATPAGFTLHATGASGSNVAAVDSLALAGAQGTGTGAGGPVLVEVSPAGSSSSSENPLVRVSFWDSPENVVLAGTGTALATNATNGFVYMDRCAGTPTGTPASLTGNYAGGVPFLVDTSGNKVWGYYGGAWNSLSGSGGSTVTTLAPLTGTAAQATGASSLAVGVNANASASASTSVGNASTASGAGSATCFGFGSASSGNSSLALGPSTNAGFDFSIALGYGSATTAANQLVCGSQGSGSIGNVTNVYFGNGVTNATPVAWTLHSTGGSGTNVAGASMSLAEGAGTGTAKGGGILFQTAAVTGSSSTLNTLANVFAIQASSKILGAVATGVYGFAPSTDPTAALDTGISRGGSAATLYVGNGTAADFSATVKATEFVGVGGVSFQATGIVEVGTSGAGASEAFFTWGSSSVINFMEGAVAGDSFDRISVNVQGTHYWGQGSSGSDLVMARQSANNLGVFGFTGSSWNQPAVFSVYNTSDITTATTGTPTPTNSEFVSLGYSVPNTAVLNSGKTGTGTVRTLSIQTNGSQAIGISAAQLVTINQTINNYHGIATAGQGVVPIVGAANITAQTAAATIATYANAAADGTFEVSASVNVSAATAISTSVQVTYTDAGNNSRTLTLPIQLTGGTGGTYLTNGLIIATGDYSTPVHQLRVKASTTITVQTSTGTFTGVTYSASGTIKQTQ